MIQKIEFRNFHEILKVKDRGQIWGWNGASSALPSPQDFSGISYVALHLAKPNRVLIAPVPSWLRGQDRINLQSERQVLNERLSSLRTATKDTHIILNTVRGQLTIHYNKLFDKFVATGTNGQQKVLPSVIWLLRAARNGFIEHPSNWKS